MVSSDTKLVGSFPEFIDALGQKLIREKLGSGWVYRGQPSKSLRLLPGAHRPGQRRGSPLAQLKHEEKMLEAFKKEAYPFIELPPRYESDWEWLALAQHHRLPTRLPVDL